MAETGLKTPAAKKILNVPKDLEVKFDDGQVVQAHALILVLASPVFRDLLTDDQGSLHTKISLPGKRADEFNLFQQALLPASLRFAALTDEATFFTLCRWAHEYEVDALKTLCEDHLIASVPVTETSLEHALTFGLARRQAQCIAEMKKDLPRFVVSLRLLATRQNVEELKDLWPLLCAAVFIEPYEKAAIHKPSPSTLLQAELKKAAMDAASTAASDALATASYYTTSLYDTLWSYAPPAPPLIKGRLKDLGMVA
ncbi:hypothetical protein Ctob_012970 [Chrysochromulina tobinii]|uniref:BTB domain-containing protein n=1 Tax=Chrysochromulina tobinii TaxID=1460289 RepID=A0A0M0K235_9EUKA|nr:hypothetical protein Ctob_012970 [Chrysochromulina tobinii]|eukprot:KOO32879.1 hypothetical protein Ctob_012970 [Chrysochromulina sp. CCMP291]